MQLGLRFFIYHLDVTNEYYGDCDFKGFFWV
jgi:hypothetical protein